MPGVAREHCLHCSALVEDGEPFCCIGCRAAHALLAARGLEKVRALTSEPLPPGRTPSPRPWLAGQSAAVVDVQGITCGACVWVIEKLATQRGVTCAVNPGIGRVDACAPDAPTLAAFLDDIETLGYRAGPPRKDGDASVDGLVLRAGLAAALAMSAMSFAFARYFGLDPAVDGGLATAFLVGELACGALAVLIGASHFVVGTVRALRLRVVPLDLPVAAGLLLAFAGSLVAFATGAGDGIFFDSLAMFAALMLLGRLAQRSMLARSRAQLLEDAGFDALPVTRLVDRVPEWTTAGALHTGDRLLLRPGDALPVRARVVDAPGGRAASFSLAWIDGESDARAFAAGDEVPAGACLEGRAAVVVETLEEPAASRLWTLLSRRDDDAPALDARWQAWAAGSLAAVLVLAALAALVWWPAGPARALEVATAVLVVTCPCALGLALPLATEIAHASLRRRGVFVRRAGFLDRLARVRSVVLDKTGTLTMGELRLTPSATANLAALVARDAEAAHALFDLTARSSHPKSRAICAALRALPATAATAPTASGAAGAARHATAVALRDVDVTEEPALGTAALIDGWRWTLQRALDPARALDGVRGGATEDDVAFARDGVVLARFTFEEELQRDALREVVALRARGLDVVLASGDRATRALNVAARLGVDADHVHAQLAPEDKAALVRSLGADRVLFVGDGVNDAAAFAAAGCAGTPALDRPQLPARADFYVVSRGLGPLAALFDEAARWRRGARAALGFAVVYNAAAVALAFAGLATPLVAAVLMPLSSIAVCLLVRALMSASLASRTSHAATEAPAEGIAVPS